MMSRCCTRAVSALYRGAAGSSGGAGGFARQTRYPVCGGSHRCQRRHAATLSIVRGPTPHSIATGFRCCRKSACRLWHDGISGRGGSGPKRPSALYPRGVQQLGDQFPSRPSAIAKNVVTRARSDEPSNQSMKPTARLRNKLSVFATTPCRGLSLSR